MKLLILAGGFGTRLKEVLPNIPKAMAPIGNVSFLQFQIECWIAQGLNEFTFLLHHQAECIISFIESHKTGLLENCKVDWVIEPTPLGTGGAIANAVNDLKLIDDFLVINSDTWLNGGFRDLIKSDSPALAVINMTDTTRYGQVQIDQNNLVTAFVEKNNMPPSGWINAGLYHLSAIHFKDWDGRPFSLEHQFFERMVQARTLKAVPLQSDFIDIGIPADYYRFCRWIELNCKLPL